MNIASPGGPCGLKTLLWLAVLALAGAAARADSPAAPPPPHWSYSGATGPPHWASEDPAFAACGTGPAQSPIDIQNATRKDLPPIQFAYQPIPLEVTDTGHTMQVYVPKGSGGITVGGDRYDLTQFHFHRPSEERIRGQRYSMVVHLVHMNASGAIAVVAVLIQANRSNGANALLQQVFDNFPPSGQKQNAVAGATLDLTGFLPQRQGYYAFDGSLTTPPCTGHVRWFVLKTPVQASSGQVAQFAVRYADNARPTQPLNGRQLLQTMN
jgi:carbonic anhydrase